jgi:uncharacterized protein (TIRG00374 family)
MLAALHSIAWWTAPLLFLTIIISMTLQGVRWWMLMRPFDGLISFNKTMRAHFLGLYYSIVLPTSAAQDAVRAGILSQHTSYSLSWASTWVSRLLGLLTLAFLSLYGLFGIKRSVLPPYFFESMIVAFAFLCLLMALSFSKRFTAPLRTILGKFLPRSLLTIIENIRQSIYLYRGKPGNLFLVFWVTLLIQIIIVVGACIVILGISGRFLFFESLLYLPIIEVLCMSIPLTPNGIGLREGMLALMFRHVGLSTEQLAIYIVLGYCSISLKLLGGLPLVFEILTKVKSDT